MATFKKDAYGKRFFALFIIEESVVKTVLKTRFCLSYTVSVTA